MPPILVIDDDGPSRAARSALQRGSAAVRISAQVATDPKTSRYDAMIADTCMLDAHSTARIHALMQGVPKARLVARTQSGAMAAIDDAPDFQAMADLLAK
jgi:hypothetical protein